MAVLGTWRWLRHQVDLGQVRHALHGAAARERQQAKEAFLEQVRQLDLDMAAAEEPFAGQGE